MNIHQKISAVLVFWMCWTHCTAGEITSSVAPPGTSSGASIHSDLSARTDMAARAPGSANFAAPPNTTSASAGAPATSPSGASGSLPANQPPAIPPPPNPCTAVSSTAALYQSLDQRASRESTSILRKPQFLPAGESAHFVVARPYNKDLAYRVFVQRDGTADTSSVLTDGDILAQSLAADDPLVAGKVIKLPTDATSVSVDLPASLDSLWTPAKVYILACEGDKHATLALISTASASLSSYNVSLAIALGFVIVGYILTAIAVSIIDLNQKKTIFPNRTWVRYLDPVVLTAGSDGKGSASKLQILFFSCVVVGLLAFVILRTGVLSNVSSTILTLLGISAFGATISGATDASKNRLDSDNWAWLIEKNWLPRFGLAAVNTARWRDIVTTDREFNVYRFQMVMFSILVGGALLASPWQDLALFKVPQNLLGLLGLSQVVYIGGKLVAPPSMSDLNSALTELRKRETAFRNAATTNADPTAAPLAPGAPIPAPLTLAAAILRGGQLAYTAYMEQARLVRRMFEAVTGRIVQSADLEPEFV